MSFADLITAVNDVIWSPALIWLCLIVGLYFTIRTMFLQFVNIPDMVKQLREGQDSADGTSSLQSLMMSLAGRVGMGNIGGVATAIAFGGPGAVFWMWVMALLGAATSFIESTLGQIYKERDPDTGEYRGGPAYYFEKAYKHTAAAPAFKVYAILFAVVTVFATSYFLPGVQANGVAAAVGEAWAVPAWVVALAMVILLAFIVLGGVKRIATFAVYVVPVMAVLYIILALIVLFLNFDQIPEVFGSIFASAFRRDSATSPIRSRPACGTGSQGRPSPRAAAWSGTPGSRCRRRWRGSSSARRRASGWPWGSSTTAPWTSR